MNLIKSFTLTMPGSENSSPQPCPFKSEFGSLAELVRAYLIVVSGDPDNKEYLRELLTKLEKMVKLVKDNLDETTEANPDEPEGPPKVNTTEKPEGPPKVNTTEEPEGPPKVKILRTFNTTEKPGVQYHGRASKDLLRTPLKSNGVHEDEDEDEDEEPLATGDVTKPTEVVGEPTNTFPGKGFELDELLERFPKFEPTQNAQGIIYSFQEYKDPDDNINQRIRVGFISKTKTKTGITIFSSIQNLTNEE